VCGVCGLCEPHLHGFCEQHASRICEPHLHGFCEQHDFDQKKKVYFEIFIFKNVLKLNKMQQVMNELKFTNDAATR